MHGVEIGRLRVTIIFGIMKTMMKKRNGQKRMKQLLESDYF